MTGAKILHRLSGLQCLPKSDNIAGLQIADLVATPIGRYVLGKPVKEDFEVVRSKFRGGPANFKGRGLIVLPKNKGWRPLRSIQPEFRLPLPFVV